jgi:transcriptional regulator with XRE-family HTH domain
VDNIKKTVGSLVRDHRRRAGYNSVEALAEVLGVHPNTVGELERGTNWISPELLPKLADVLKVSPAEFFPGAQPELLRLELIALLASGDKDKMSSVLPTLLSMLKDTLRADAKVSKQN